MKSKVIILSLILLSISDCFSQKYFPFPTDSAIWIEVFVIDNQGPPPPFQFCSTSSNFLLGDTIIQGKTYSKLYVTDSLVDSNFNAKYVYYAMAIREDSQKKVWKIGKFDSTEVLYLDFGLNAGDTFYSPFAGEMHVARIDSILVDGDYRRLTNFEIFSGPQDSASLIEGVGFMGGLFGPSTGYDAYTRLKCLNQNWNVVFEIREPYSCDCSGCFCKSYFVGIENNTPSEIDFKLYPNPAVNTLNIFFGNPTGEVLKIDVYSTNGKLVKTLDMKEEYKSFDVSNLNPGIYLLKSDQKTKNHLGYFIKSAN